MTLSEIIDKLRIKVQDIAGSNLWSDDELIAHINTAFNVASYTADLIYDKSSSLVQFEAQPNVISYQLDSSIYRIKKVRANGRILEEVYIEDIDKTYPRGYGLGVISAWYIDADNSFNLFKTPNLRTDIKIEAYRMPRPLVNYEDVSELPNIYIDSALNYACKLCYEKLDTDTNQRDLAVFFENEFSKVFGQPKPIYALRDQHRSKITKVPARRF